MNPSLATPMEANPMARLDALAAWLPGARRVGADVALARVHTDTRSLQPGDLFVALRGERFDANDFLAQARAQGAVAALAERGLAEAGLPGYEVADSRAALGQLAAGWRGQFTLPLIGVTGSNGKTTLTQMVAAILRAWLGEAALATQGNLNNDIGVPLTLLRLRAAHRAAVVELGMNHPGEIARLAAWARPTVAVVNNAQREHQEFMATVEAVARENGAVLQALPADGVAVFPADDPYTPLWRGLSTARRQLGFGLDSATAEVRGQARWLGDAWQVQAQTPAGALAFGLRVAGRHNVRNALAALACAWAAGAPLDACALGLSGFEPVKGRSRALALHLGGHALTLVDDSYNANPDSVRAAIDVLADLPGPRLLVLGDMGEVGDQGPAFHHEVGAYARERGVEALCCLGTQAAASARAYGDGGLHFDDMAALTRHVLARGPEFHSVLVKGSRFMQMERVVEALTRHAQPPEEMAHAA